MSINWANVASSLSSITTSLSSLGITGTTATTILNDIGAASNPNQSEELQLCTQLLMAAGNPALVYVATASGGLFKTTNGGTTWTPIFDHESTISIGNSTGVDWLAEYRMETRSSREGRAKRKSSVWEIFPNL